MKFSEYIYININRSVVIHFLANNLGLDTIAVCQHIKQLILEACLYEYERHYYHFWDMCM